MKIKTLLAASSIAALALVSSAVAQDKATTSTKETTATTEKMDLKGTWRSSKLIGLNVYNRADEKLGDIDEILLDKAGKVEVEFPIAAIGAPAPGAAAGGGTMMQGGGMMQMKPQH